MKGVIVAAGYGTRFLPVTKTIPKEMLPLLNRPSIDFVMEEFADSGIDEILIITSRRKKALEDYCDRAPELEAVFERDEASQKLAQIVPTPASVYFLRQREMLGSGHAILQARSFVGGDPFVVAFPDDLHFGTPPLSKQLIDVYETTGCSVLATMYDPPDIHRYASLKLDEDGSHVLDMIEKAEPGTEPSREASIGRYLYSAGYLDALARGWELHNGRGEYYHVYGLQEQMKERKVVRCRFTGTRLDTGAPDGYLKAILTHAAGIPEYREILTEMLRDLLSEEPRSGN